MHVKLADFASWKDSAIFKIAKECLINFKNDLFII